MSTIIQIIVKKAHKFYQVPHCYLHFVLFFSIRYKFYILTTENLPHVFSNLQHNKLVLMQDSRFFTSPDCFPFSLDLLPLSKNCFLFVVLGDRQVALSSIIISWWRVQQPFFETTLRECFFYQPPSGLCTVLYGSCKHHK